MTYTTAQTTAQALEVGDVLDLNSGPFLVTAPVTADADGYVRITGTNGDGVEGWEMVWPADVETLIRIETCEHGLSADLCAGPMHYPDDRY